MAAEVGGRVVLEREREPARHPARLEAAGPLRGRPRLEPRQHTQIWSPHNSNKDRAGQQGGEIIN